MCHFDRHFHRQTPRNIEHIPFDEEKKAISKDGWVVIACVVAFAVSLCFSGKAKADQSEQTANVVPAHCKGWHSCYSVPDCEVNSLERLKAAQKECTAAMKDKDEQAKAAQAEIDGDNGVKK